MEHLPRQAAIDGGDAQRQDDTGTGRFGGRRPPKIDGPHGHKKDHCRRDEVHQTSHFIGHGGVFGDSLGSAGKNMAMRIMDNMNNSVRQTPE